MNQPPAPALHRLARATTSLLVTTLLGASLLSSCKKQAGKTAATEKVKVETTKVGPIDAPELLRLTGTLRGARETSLAANVAGRVLETKVERGTHINEGDIIARVDVRAAALQLKEARAQVERSKTQQEIDQVECERYEKLKEHGAVTDVEYAQVMARCKQAPLNLDAAQARATLAAKSVGDGVIRAPFSGVVTERLIEVGEYVQPSTRVVALADVDSLHLELSVPEANYPNVKVGSDVTFRVIAYGNREFTGQVVHVGGAVRSTRDVLVEARVENPDGALLPGMFANVAVVVGRQPLPAVPKSAVFEQNEKSNAFVVKSGVLEQRVLHVTESLEGRIPVLEGVAVGEQVVATYRPELKNGQLVE